jgi:hypothetical protein
LVNPRFPLLSRPGDIILDAMPQEMLPPGPDFACAMLGEGAWDFSWNVFKCTHFLMVNPMRMG